MINDRLARLCTGTREVIYIYGEKQSDSNQATKHQHDRIEKHRSTGSKQKKTNEHTNPRN